VKLLDGIHPGVHREAYDRIERINFSTLKFMMKSPAHLHHAQVTPGKDTDPKKLGRAVHIATLEPERFKSACAIWDGGTRRGKDWDRFVEENEGRELLTEREHEVCLALQTAVRSDPVAKPYLSKGKGEVTLLWTQERKDGVNGYSMPAKGRIDFDAPGAIVDLKTTRNASPDGFAREVWTYRYHAQAAWYSDGYERATGRRKPYVIVAVESEPPHVVTVFLVPEVVLQLGRDEYSLWLDRLAACRASNSWPGYREAEAELELPRWAYPDDDDISGTGLKFGGVEIGVPEEG
jgi:hypothetical protein